MSITREKRRMKNQVGDIDIYYLEHGTVEGGPVHDDFELFLRTEDEWKKIWIEQRDKIMESWIREHPCTRPWVWWKFESLEPRARVGGIGTPSHEVLAVSPCFEFGIPTGWVSKFEEDYFNGRKIDIHGYKIGTNNEGDFLGVAIDPNDSPIFESEATYLQRHNLLTDAEKKFIEKNPSSLEPEKVEFEAEE